MERWRSRRILRTRLNPETGKTLPLFYGFGSRILSQISGLASSGRNSGSRRWFPLDMKVPNASHTLAWSMAGLTALTGVALAQSGGARWEKMMHRYDRDGDGRITAGEFRGPPPLFTWMDENEDGAITREEARQMRGRPPNARQARNGPDGAPAVGSDAPAVRAKTPGGEEIDLSDPTRITVLVFGSHT